MEKRFNNFEISRYEYAFYKKQQRLLQAIIKKSKITSAFEFTAFLLFCVILFLIYTMIGC